MDQFGPTFWGHIIKSNSSATEREVICVHKRKMNLPNKDKSYVEGEIGLKTGRKLIMMTKMTIVAEKMAVAILVAVTVATVIAAIPAVLYYM